MSIVEKNDVDIGKLFSWSQRFELIYGDNVKVDVFIRLLGDADIGKARVASLRRSTELRRKLRDIGSDERLAYIQDIEEMDREKILALITVFSMRDLTVDILPKLKIKTPKQPKSDASTEALEKYQAEVDSYPFRRQAEIRDLLEVAVEKLKSSHKKDTIETLYELYIKMFINELCEQELLNAFKDWCVYLGSYKDEVYKEKFFSSFEEFNNMAPNLKEQFTSAYGNLEIYGDELKKLRQVTP